MLKFSLNVRRPLSQTSQPLPHRSAEEEQRAQRDQPVQEQKDCELRTSQNGHDYPPFTLEAAANGSATAPTERWAVSV